MLCQICMTKMSSETSTLYAARRAQRRANGHDMKSHGSGQEASENKPGTCTRLLIPTEDQKNGAEGGFLAFLVGTIYMQVVVVSSVSVSGWPSADLITDLAVDTKLKTLKKNPSTPSPWSSAGIKSPANVSSLLSDTSCPDPLDFIS